MGVAPTAPHAAGGGHLDPVHLGAHVGVVLGQGDPQDPGPREVGCRLEAIVAPRRGGRDRPDGRDAGERTGLEPVDAGDLRDLSFVGGDPAGDRSRGARLQHLHRRAKGAPLVRRRRGRARVARTRPRGGRWRTPARAVVGSADGAHRTPAAEAGEANDGIHRDEVRRGCSADVRQPVLEVVEEVRTPRDARDAARVPGGVLAEGPRRAVPGPAGAAQAPLPSGGIEGDGPVEAALNRRGEQEAGVRLAALAVGRDPGAGWKSRRRARGGAGGQRTGPLGRCAGAAVRHAALRGVERRFLAVVPGVERQLRLARVQHDKGAVVGDVRNQRDDLRGHAVHRVMGDHGGAERGQGAPPDQVVEPRAVLVGGRGGDRPRWEVEGRPCEGERARVRVHGEEHAADDLEREDLEVEHDLSVQARRRANVEHRDRGGAVGIRLATLAVRPAHLAHKAQHGRLVIRLQREGLPAGAAVRGRIEGVRRRAVVVDVDSPALDDAPRRGTETRAARARVGVTVDPAPGVLGPVEGLRMRRHGHKPEARVAVHVVRHGLGVDVVAVTLPHSLGGEVAP